MARKPDPTVSRDAAILRKQGGKEAPTPKAAKRVSDAAKALGKRGGKKTMLKRKRELGPAAFKAAQKKFAELPRPSRKLLPNGGTIAAAAKRRVNIPTNVLTECDKRSQAGESIRSLAAEFGIDHQTLGRRIKKLH